MKKNLKERHRQAMKLIDLFVNRILPIHDI